MGPNIWELFLSKFAVSEASSAVYYAKKPINFLENYIS
jgi:hypothetical protein